ncbi:nucleolar protein 14-like [Chenopodium quinoa]|uniref:nucleolar protein 14-like n=1 Tax=Chenopodium quinoa TaxID=63459 RepID=UPI000B778EA3|nr:nucleolar protein 14-like [Chenopodium quinoa]
MAKNNGSETKKKNKKKSKQSGVNKVSMKLKSVPKDNPFETIWSRRKFDVIGKKRKGEERRIGQARARAIDKRKKTLLKEYEQSGKASVFVDARIGEQNDNLGEFDKAILRSQRERQMKIKKTNKFNLSDEEEDDLNINDGLRDDFNDEVEYGSDEETGQDRSSILRLGRKSVDADIAEGEENRVKSKKEVMEEIIQKSKFFKEQKAREKEENEKLVDQLDKDFESLVQSDALSSLTQPSKMNALKALVNPNFSKDLKKKEVISVSDVSKQDEPDIYDKLVSEMAFEMRARPSDRTKTPEEIAEEEKERLERLEQERLDRMRATDDTSEEDGDDSEDDVKHSANKQSHVSGDDLGDSFTVDDKSLNKKGWVDEILEKNVSEDTGDENSGCSDDSDESEDDEEGTDNEEDDGKGETLKDWEQSEDDLVIDLDEKDESDEEEEGEDDKTQEERKDKKNERLVNPDRKEKKKTALLNLGVAQSSRLKQELPFKIDAPGSMEDLYALFQDRSNEDIIEAIMRIRKCNPILLAAENRKKMQVFYGLLLQYFATLPNQNPLNFQLLNLLVKPLMEMSTEIPYFSAICARERILRTRTKFTEDIKDPEKSSWPSLKTLLLLRLWSMIYPCSDFRHAVMTPASLLMCEYLTRCPVLSVRDAAIGSFLCSIIFLVTKDNKKYFPEALMFLKALLVAAIDKDPKGIKDSQMYQHLLEFKAPVPLLRIEESIKDIKPLDFLKIMKLPEDSSFFNSQGFRASVLVSVVETLRGFVNVYGEFKAFPEIFLPVSALMVKVADQQNMPGPLQEKLRDVGELITTKVKECHKVRQPLQMRKQKPVPIKLLNPKFEENFIKGRDYDPDRVRAENKKMRRLLRKERRGAVSELRKDNYFLQEVKMKEKQRLDEERAENYGKARAFLQEQEHNFKSGQLGKGRKRRR